MITQRIMDFLDSYHEDGPVLVIDTHRVHDNLLEFRKNLPDSKIFYAIKANPEPKILQLLADNGSSFDCAGVREIEMALATGISPDRISYGNTIKKQHDILRAYNLGVRLFAVDSISEVEKLAEVAPGAKVFCRILTDGEGADWPLSRKFGCSPSMAVDVLARAYEVGSIPYGVSFHVGSQMTRTDAWDKPIAQVRQIFDKLSEIGIKLKLVNLGGGFPTPYTSEVPTVVQYGKAIKSTLMRHFPEGVETLIEPGRGMVGNAGVIRTEVVLVSQKDHNENHRWVYLDIGKYGGLSETTDEAIRYPIVTPRDSDPTVPCILAGPTCDSADVMYEKRMVELPATLTAGDKIFICHTGVYTSTYSAVAFNGFPPLKTFTI